MVPGVVDLQVEKQVLIPHSILASLLTSVTVTPVLSYYLLSGRIVEHAGDNFVARHLKRGNRGLLNWAFDHRGIVVGTAAVAVVVAAYAATLLPRLVTVDGKDERLFLTSVAGACTRFRRHRVRCFDGAGGGSWRDGSLRESSYTLSVELLYGRIPYSSRPDNAAQSLEKVGGGPLAQDGGVNYSTESRKRRIKVSPRGARQMHSGFWYGQRDGQEEIVRKSSNDINDVWRTPSASSPQ
jgi:hypothetical protein